MEQTIIVRGWMPTTRGYVPFVSVPDAEREAWSRQTAERIGRVISDRLPEDAKGGSGKAARGL